MMATIWEPPPTPDEIMRRTAMWVARLYGVKITFTIDEGGGDVGTTQIDRLTASAALSGGAVADAVDGADRSSRCMFVARLENMQKNGDHWLTVTAVLALLNDCDMLAASERA